MGRATYKLAKQFGGLGHYAEVTASADFSSNCSISVAPCAFDWLKAEYGPNAVVDGPGFEAYRAAASLGATFSLSHIVGRDTDALARVVIECIRTSTVDTTPADITFAACQVVWAALEVEGSTLPELK